MKVQKGSPKGRPSNQELCILTQILHYYSPENKCPDTNHTIVLGHVPANSTQCLEMEAVPISKIFIQSLRFLYNLQYKPTGLALALQLLLCFYKLLCHLIIFSLEEFLRRVNLRKFSKLNWIYCPIMPFSYPSSFYQEISFCLHNVFKGQKEDLRYVSFTEEYLSMRQLLHFTGREANFRGF